MDMMKKEYAVAPGIGVLSQTIVLLKKKTRLLSILKWRWREEEVGGRWFRLVLVFPKARSTLYFVCILCFLVLAGGRQAGR